MSVLSTAEQVLLDTKLTNVDLLVIPNLFLVDTLEKMANHEQLCKEKLVRCTHDLTNGCVKSKPFIKMKDLEKHLLLDCNGLNIAFFLQWECFGL